MEDQQGAAQRIPKMKVRTMASDLKSMQESGGGAPKGYVPQTGMPAQAGDAPAPPPVPAQPAQPTPQPPPPAGPPQPPPPAGGQPQPPVSQPQPPTKAQSAAPDQVPSGKKRSNKTIFAVLAIFLAFVFGIIIYFALQLLLP